MRSRAYHRTVETRASSHRRHDSEDDRERRIARALEFMESKLYDPFPMDEAAGEAAWSLWHFHRRFAEVVGIPPGSYLRRRRLSEAARDLAEGSDSVGEIALARGFNSAEAFVRSFAAHFGSSPGEYRRRLLGILPLRPFVPVRKPFLAGGDVRLSSGLGGFEILELPAVRLAGLSQRIGLNPEKLSTETEAFWAVAGPSIRLLADRLAGRIHCLGYASSEPGEASFRYTIAVELPEECATPAGFEAIEIPAGEYCRTIHQGSASTIPESWLQVYASLLPRLGRSPRGGFDFERPLGPSASGIHATELFVPLSEAATPG